MLVKSLPSWKPYVATVLPCFHSAQLKRNNLFTHLSSLHLILLLLPWVYTNSSVVQCFPAHNNCLFLLDMQVTEYSILSSCQMLRHSRSGSADGVNLDCDGDMQCMLGPPVINDVALYGGTNHLTELCLSKTLRRKRKELQRCSCTSDDITTILLNTDYNSSILNYQSKIHLYSMLNWIKFKMGQMIWVGFNDGCLFMFLHFLLWSYC